MKKLILLSGLLCSFATTKTSEEPKSIVLKEVERLATFRNMGLILGVAATRMVAEDLIFPALDRQCNASEMNGKVKIIYECAKFSAVAIPIIYIVDRFHD